MQAAPRGPRRPAPAGRRTSAAGRSAGSPVVVAQHAEHAAQVGAAPRWPGPGSRPRCARSLVGVEVVAEGQGAGVHARSARSGGRARRASRGRSGRAPLLRACATRSSCSASARSARWRRVQTARAASRCTCPSRGSPTVTIDVDDEVEPHAGRRSSVGTVAKRLRRDDADQPDQHDLPARAPGGQRHRGQHGRAGRRARRRRSQAAVSSAIGERPAPPPVDQDERGHADEHVEPEQPVAVDARAATGDRRDARRTDEHAQHEPPDVRPARSPAAATASGVGRVHAAQARAADEPAGSGRRSPRTPYFGRCDPARGPMPRRAGHWQAGPMITVEGLTGPTGVSSRSTTSASSASRDGSPASSGPTAPARPPPCG